MVTVTPESRATLRTSLGNLVLEFISDKAPRTCENFATLAHKGFYDGTKFHRIIKDFIVQGGCPHGNGKGGPGYTIRPEFNDTPHVTGVVSMARDTDPHSAGSQFFICLGDARYLDSRYTAFARVVEGDDVLEKLAAVSTDIQPKYKEKSVPRDPVFLNGIEFEGVDFTSEDSASTSNGEAAAGDQDDQGSTQSEAPKQGNAAGEGSSSGGRRNRRGRGRRGKGGGDRSGTSAERSGESGERESGGESSAAVEAPANAASEPAAAADEKPPAKKATRKKAVRKTAAAEGGAEDKPAAPARKKATRKKATRKKATKDTPKDGE